jgi:hypothetical protein
MAVVIVRHKQSGAAVKYTVADSWLSKLVEMNKSLEPRGRYVAIMAADGLFGVTPQKQ